MCKPSFFHTPLPILTALFLHAFSLHVPVISRHLRTALPYSPLPPLPPSLCLAHTFPLLPACALALRLGTIILPSAPPWYLLQLPWSLRRPYLSLSVSLLPYLSFASCAARRIMCIPLSPPGLHPRHVPSSSCSSPAYVCHPFLSPPKCSHRHVSLFVIYMTILQLFYWHMFSVKELISTVKALVLPNAAFPGNSLRKAPILLL